jgi:succinate-semialdehyde dehydrogenase/glutarate-semialdehyde dehydrogenase
MSDYPQLKLYIGGEWKTADGAPVINPADESVLGTVPHATRADLDDALAAAEEGFRIWSRTAPSKRAEIILKAAQIMRGRVEEMAVAMTLEQGKPIAQSRLEILRGCEIIEWDAMRRKAAVSMAALSPVSLACAIRCCVSQSAWSRRSRRGTFR